MITDTSSIRGHYGEITQTSADTAIMRGRDILRAAWAAGVLTPPYVDVDRKHRGTALSYDLYDVAPGAVLVQQRYTVCTRYGNSPTKRYYLLTRSRGEVSCTPMDPHKAVIAKLAKTGPRLGAIIAHVRGRRRLALPGTPAPPPETAYKLLRDTPDGLRSVWDDSPWTIGTPRREGARRDHEGGLYYYRTLEEAVRAASEKRVYRETMDHSRLAVVEIEAAGRRVEYPNGKVAATQITPIRVLAHTL